ncbi:MAG: hypothetical protein KY452_07750, partial [Actinobacteria bacterium]|nr:hypothetical protein [Actinomycetota bacterium]
MEYADASRLIGPRIDDVGDLREVVARDERDVEGLYVHLERGVPTPSSASGTSAADGGVVGPVERVIVR